MKYDIGEYAYLKLLEELLEQPDRIDRTGTGTRSVFGRQLRFDLREGFPLLTTKKVHFQSIKVELLWFLRGDTNVEFLHEHGVSIWDEWADSSGELGPIYGWQWRHWATGDDLIDQIDEVVGQIKGDPYSRRHIVTSWNPSDIMSMALPPCHCMFQFYVESDHQLGDPTASCQETKRLSCHMYQRSADVFLGVPFNIASYALLTHLIAMECDLEVGDLVISFGDVHLYLNHIEQAKEQLRRTPRSFPLFSWNSLEKPESLYSIDPELIDVVCYNPHPAIKAEVSV